MILHSCFQPASLTLHPAPLHLHYWAVAQVGDRVIALSDYRAWAELVAVPATSVFKIPENVSFEDGACLLMNYVTAYILLFDLANLRKGQSLLIHSAGGGVVSGAGHLWLD